VAGVPSPTEFGRVQDWSDFAQFANITDSTGTHGVAYWLSAAENVGNQDIGTPLDTLLANLGSPSYPGLAAPKSTDNVVFLVEREAGRSGDNNPSQLKGGKGGGQSNPNNSYLTNNITYNTHTDPPGPSPVTVTGQLTNTATVTANNETAAETTDSSTASITITALGSTLLPKLHVSQVADSVANSGTKAGFTVLITNDGAATATGVTLSDLLPPGQGKDINWTIDTTVGNPTAFTITGALGSQSLGLTSSSSSLAGGRYLEVHITGGTSAADAPASGFSNTVVGVPTVNAANEVVTDQNNSAIGDLTVSIPIVNGDYATPGFWNKWNSALLTSLNGGPNATNLSQWLVASFPNLYGPNAGAHSMVPGGVYLTNAQVAQNYLNNFWVNGSNGKVAATDANVLSAAFAVYATSATLAGGTYATSYGFNVSPDGTGLHTYNVGTLGLAAFDVPNSSAQSVINLLWDIDSLADSTGVISDPTDVNAVFSIINSNGHIQALSSGAVVNGEGANQALVTMLQPISSGTMVVAVDSTTLDQAGEQARIADAVATLNSTLGSFGVNLVEIQGDDSVAADVHIHMASTSAIGGAADGVLGATQAGGEITLISGWNYYLGSDPNAVGDNQYDFQTVATHELGHALGLGHSTDQNSVMYWSLAPSQAKRDLTTNDLKVIRDTDTGPEPLMAVPFAQGHAAAAERSTPPKQTTPLPVAGHQGVALLISGQFTVSSPMVVMPFDPGIQVMQGAFASPLLVVGSGDNLEVGGIGTDDALGLATPGKESDSAVLVGGAGNDLVGGEGRNLMIGGFGVERFSNEQSTLTPAKNESNVAGSATAVESGTTDIDAAWVALIAEDSFAFDDGAVADNFFAFDRDAVGAALAE
jgi:uncharacterized repeat protein (TIGR01451 family)